MRRLFHLVSAAIGWVGLHLAYFAWYHRALDLTFSRTTALFTALFAAGSFALLLAFHNAWMRILALLAYAAALGWTLADFAYVQVFDKFLAFSVSRAGSLNLPMLDLLKDYVFLVPRGLAAAAAAFLMLAIFSAFHLGTALRRRSVPVGFFHGGSSVFDHSHGHAGFALLALAIHAACVVGTVQAADRYREQASAESDLLGDLGVFGYGVAAERAKAGEGSVAGVAAESSASTGASLDAAMSTVEAARDSLNRLYAHSPTATSSTALPRYEKPPHIIIYQLESVAAWPLEQEPSPMPYLESLLAESGHVDEYFANGCDTIDAEFAINCGFLPETHGPVSDLYAKNDYQCLPSVLERRGYATAVYHANDPKFWSRDALHPAWGFDEMIFSPAVPFRLPDGQLLDRVIDDIKKDSRPSLRYVVGFTSHSPHSEELRDYYRAEHDFDVEPYGAPLGDTARSMESDEETTRDYLGFLTSVDGALRHLFERLESEGLLENTIVVAFGDHRYYQSASDEPMKAFRDYNRVPFVIHAPGLGGISLAPTASHIDVPSTLYELVTGSTEGLPLSFLGRSLFSSDRSTGTVNKCLGRTSYYDGRQVVEGDVTFDLFRSSADAGVTPDDGSIANGLRDVAEVTDLALKRNDLGGTAVANQLVGGEKLQLGNLADSDGDGLSNARERSLGLDPKMTDTDGDGYSDGEEVTNGYNPLGPGEWVRGE